MPSFFPFLSPPAFEVSQVSQTSMALGQHAIFEVSQRVPSVTLRKPQETRMAVGLVTLVTLRKGVGEGK
jgi:hypothetical protein